MKNRKIILAVVLLFWITRYPTAMYAQEPPADTPPKPAAKGYFPVRAGEDQDEDQTIPAMQPDERPLTGFQQLTLGTPSERHSYWIPGISYTNVVQSNALAQGGGNGWNSTSYISGNFSLLQNWTSSRLSINYSGGESLSSDSAVGDGQFHQFAGSQTFSWRRAQLMFLDQFSYLPSSQFGFGAGTGLALPGVGGPLGSFQPGLQNGFIPNQSVFTQVGPVYSNAAGTQLNYALSARSSVTIGGVFGIMRFSESGGVESNEAILNAGYNHQVSRSDILGLSYRFSAYEYLGSPQAMGDHLVQAVYGKKITGRLAIKLSGGPEITTFRIPPGVSASKQYVAGAGSASLSYGFASGSVSLSYNHGVNNGSGVFVGATSDQVTASGDRKLNRVWTGNVSLGYARNTNVAGTVGGQGQAYDTLYVGAGLQRPLSRTANFTLNYTANIQTSNNTVCAGPNCATNFTTHIITVGLNWHARPFVLH